MILNEIWFLPRKSHNINLITRNLIIDAFLLPLLHFIAHFTNNNLYKLYILILYNKIVNTSITLLNFIY